MFKRIKDRWVKALLSGKYKQGSDVLYDPNIKTYCCLGVLCDLYINSAAGKKVNAQWNSDGVLISDIGTYEKYSLPSEVVNWAGLGENVDVLLKDKPAAELNDKVNMNNGRHNFTFRHIADRIQKHLSK